MEERRSRLKDRSDLIACLPVSLIFLLFLSFYINWADFFQNPPIHYTDYAAHYSAVWSVSEYLDQGHLWGYNPYFLAGFPDGTLSDIDNKGVEVMSWLLSKTNLSLPLSYNLVILILLALLPLTIYFAARSLKLPPVQAAFAQLLGAILWFGDPTWSWAWQGGMIAFLSAVCVSLFISGSFWRWSFNPAEHVFSRWFFLWFILGGLVFWLHPFAVIILTVPFGFTILSAWRVWDRRQRRLVGLWILFSILVNLPWAILLLRFLPDKTGSEQFLQGGMQQLLIDLRSNYLGLRLIVIGLALLGIERWRKAGHTWFLAALLSILALFLLAYLGVYLAAGSLQPYRFVIAALAFSIIPASAGFFSLWRQNNAYRLLLLIILFLVAFVPLNSARPRHRLQNDGTPRDYLSGLMPGERAVCEALMEFDLQAGRVLTNDWRLGAALPICSGAQVIGGPFLWVWTSYGYANTSIDEVFNRNLSTIDVPDMSSLLQQYNVHWIVANKRIHPQYYTIDLWNQDNPGLFTTLAAYGNFEIYHVDQASTWFLEGEGQVNAELNKIIIENASSGGLILKYHWIETLRTDPRLELNPIMVGADPKPFIKVENGDIADFTIYQEYR